MENGTCEKSSGKVRIFSVDPPFDQRDVGEEELRAINASSTSNPAEPVIFASSSGKATPLRSPVPMAVQDGRLSPLVLRKQAASPSGPRTISHDGRLSALSYTSAQSHLTTDTQQQSMHPPDNKGANDPPPAYTPIPFSEYTGQRANTCIHLFRSEVTNMAMYRIRLDTSTNWAVSTTGLLTVFASQEENVPHYFFAIIAFMNFIFLIIESRRFAIYRHTQKKVLLLHTGFYAAGVFGHVPDETSGNLVDVIPEEELIIPGEGTRFSVTPDWERKIKTMLLTSENKSVRWPTIYHRFERNYAYLFLATYLGWVFKLANEDGGMQWTPFVVVTALLVVTYIAAYLFRPKNYFVDDY